MGNKNLFLKVLDQGLKEYLISHAKIVIYFSNSSPSITFCFDYE